MSCLAVEPGSSFLLELALISLTDYSSDRHYGHPSDHHRVRPSDHPGHFLVHPPTGIGKADTASAAGMVFEADMDGRLDIDAAADRVGRSTGGAAGPGSVHYM